MRDLAEYRIECDFAVDACPSDRCVFHLDALELQQTQDVCLQHPVIARCYRGEYVVQISAVV